MNQRFSVHFTPVPTAARVTRERRGLRWRIVTTIISLLILAAVWYFLGNQWSTTWTVVIVALWVLSSAFWLTVSAVGLSRAKKDLAAIPDGVAFHIDPEGIAFLAPERAAVRWGDIERIAVRGGRGGAGPRFAVEPAAGKRIEIPLSTLDATAATLDSMVRAISLGRHHLDATRLERAV